MLEYARLAFEAKTLVAPVVADTPDKPAVATEANAPAQVNAEAVAKAQALIDKSKRIGLRGNKVKIPAGLGPTIKITGWKYGDDLRYGSKTCGAGKVPPAGGYEYLIVVTDGTNTDESAASHGKRDGRMWTKVPGRVTQFIVVLTTNRNKIIEYSPVVNVPAA